MHNLNMTQCPQNSWSDIFKGLHNEHEDNYENPRPNQKDKANTSEKNQVSQQRNKVIPKLETHKGV